MNTYSEEEITTPLHERLLGNHPCIQEINSLIERLAQTDLTVLITGETGTGKDIAARLLHKSSPRSSEPFVKVNCPSVPETILESELFGYERGSFTGAHALKPGRFELAHRGTIFLDEICEIGQHVQGKLLQILDGESFLRIGGTQPVHANVRVVAATNVSLDTAVERGRLRKDVAFRLSEVVVHIPPLRERRSDIPLLAEHFNYNMCLMLKKEYLPLNAKLMSQMQEMDWPGNIRELAGRVKEYVATGSKGALLAQETKPSPTGAQEQEQEPERRADGGRSSAAPSGSARKFIPLKEAARRAAEAAERALIEETLRYTLWNRRKAAKLLGTSYSSLLRRIDAYKIGKS